MRRLLGRSSWHIVVAVSATVMFVVGFGGSLRRIAMPLGSGDLVFSYAFAAMWSEGAPFGNSSLGYPFGIELRYFPTTDILPNAVAGLLGAMTENPFLGLNMVFALSFPVTGLIAYWVLGLAGLRGPVAVLMALAYTAIPFHWLRIEHLYLATMYSAALGVGLALLIGTGEVERRLRGHRPWRSVLMLLGIAVVLATGGVYYACFALLLGAVALVYRFARGARWRGLVLSVAPLVATGVFTALALAPAWLYTREHPTISPVAGRLATESVTYSGTLAYALLPAPFSDIPGMGAINDAVTSLFAQGLGVGSVGVLWYANFGSLLTVAALLLASVGLVVVSRRSSRGAAVAAPDMVTATQESPVSFGLVGLLLGTALLFFVPWGLNFLFAATVTPQLRAWDRLIPVLFLLVFTGAAVAWRALGLPRRGRRVGVVAAVTLVVLTLDSVVPYRSFFDTAAAAGSQESWAGYAYARDVNAAIPGECGVLELPYMGFPEMAPVENLPSYAPLWPGLTNPEKSWTFGAMKLTRADVWLSELKNSLDESDVENLTAAGFCAVHVDLRGFTADGAATQVLELTELLGSPVATGHGADWLMFALPSAGESPGTGLDDFVSLPNDLQLFFAPPTFLKASVANGAPEVDGTSEWWWVGLEPATFDIVATDDDADFTEVSGELRAAECGSQTVTVELVDGGTVVSDVVELVAGEVGAFTLRLPEATTSAQLVVNPKGTSCVLDGDARERTVALVDPQVES